MYVSKESVFKAVYYLGLPIIIGILSTWAAYLLIVFIKPVNALYTSFVTYEGLTATPNPNILVLAAKGDTPQELGQAEEVEYIPRRFHAELATLLDKAGAKGLVLDYSFTDPMPTNDKVLRQSLRQLESMWVVFGLETASEDEQTLVEMGGDPNIGRIAWKPSAVLAEGSIPKVYDSSLFGLHDQNDEFMGFHPIQKDAVTGASKYYIGFLAGLLARGWNPAEGTQIDDERLSAAGKQWPFDPANMAIFLDLPGTPRPFAEMDYKDALEALRGGNKAPFENKVVVVGRFGGSDVHRLPTGDTTEGAILVAHVIDLTLRGGTNQPQLSNFVNAFLGALVSALAAFGIIQGSRVFQVFIPLTVVSTAIFVLPRLLSKYQVGPHSFFWGLSACIATILTMLLFALVSRRQDFRVPGMVEDATVMFLDMRNSTALVNRIGGPEYQRKVGALNTQFAVCITHHGGILERTTGDGFIAVFRPGMHGNHAQRCLDCAKELMTIRDKHPELVTDPVIEYSIGFESGEVSGGYVWEDGHRVWSSSGSTVNLAQRIQGICANEAQTMGFGPNSKTHLTDSPAIVSLGKFVIKGFDEKLEIFSSKEHAYAL